jgi:hypothetical protein
MIQGNDIRIRGVHRRNLWDIRMLIRLRIKLRAKAPMKKVRFVRGWVSCCMCSRISPIESPYNMVLTKGGRL